MYTPLTSYQRRKLPKSVASAIKQYEKGLNTAAKSLQRLMAGGMTMMEGPNGKPTPMYRSGGIHINPANRGKFTAAAKSRGKGVQEFANTVLHNPDNYSPQLVRRAQFAHNAAGWNHRDGGMSHYNYAAPFFGMNSEKITYLNSPLMYGASFQMGGGMPPQMGGQGMAADPSYDHMMQLAQGPMSGVGEGQMGEMEMEGQSNEGPESGEQEQMMQQIMELVQAALAGDMQAMEQLKQILPTLPPEVQQQVMQMLDQGQQQQQGPQLKCGGKMKRRKLKCGGMKGKYQVGGVMYNRRGIK